MKDRLKIAKVTTFDAQSIFSFHYEFSSICKKYYFDFVLLGIIIFISLTTWYSLTEGILGGDSFLYLLYSYKTAFWKQPFAIGSFEASAVTYGNLFSRLFGVTFPLYFWAELIVMNIINILFYVFVFILTKKRLVAFTATLFLAVNYFGNWDMYSNHSYTFFLERIINAPWMILSLMFLHLYLTQNKIKYFSTSVIFYTLGVGLGHFSILFSPTFIFYPITYKFFKSQKNKYSKSNEIWIVIIYLFTGASIMFLQQLSLPGFGPKWSFIDFMMHPNKYQHIDKIVAQLVNWSQYPMILKSLDNNAMNGIINVGTRDTISLYVVVIYFLAGILIYKKLQSYRAILFTCAFSVTAIFYLNSYFNQYAMLYYTGSSRYLYYPTFILVLFWVLFLWAAFFDAKNVLVKLVGIGIVGMYVLVNISLIRGNFEWVNVWNIPTKKMHSYIVDIRDSLKENTLVVGESPLIGHQEAVFFTEQLGRGQIVYSTTSKNYDDWEKLASSASHLIFLVYNNTCKCIIETANK